MENLTSVNDSEVIATSGESSPDLSTTPPNNLGMLDVVSAEYKDAPKSITESDSPDKSEVISNVEYFDIRFNSQGALVYNTNMDVYKALGAIDVVKAQMIKDITSAGDTRSVLDAALENYFIGHK